MSESTKRELEIGDNLLLIVLMALATCTANTAWSNHTRAECLKAGHAPKDCGM